MVDLLLKLLFGNDYSAYLSQFSDEAFVTVSVVCVCVCAVLALYIFICFFQFLLSVLGRRK